MLQFPRMKKTARIVLRFVLSILAVEVLVGAALTALAVAEGRFTTVLEVLTGEPVAALPLAVLLASFLSYFPLSRQFKYRPLGYLLLFALNAAAMAAPVLAFKLGWLPSPASLPVMPSEWGYASVADWYLGLDRLSWLNAGAGVASFSAFAAAFWGVSRLSAKRPLWGAFLTPGLILLSLYLLNAFLSGVADAGFKLIGLTLSRHASSAVLAAVAAAGLMLFDALLCPKTDPGRQHG